MRKGMRFAGLDGIKGLALIGVIWYHLSQRTLPGGFLGVEVFYTVSGLLLGNSLLSEIERSGRVALPRFYLRRFARLWPALVLLVPAVVTFGLLIDHDALVGIRGQSAAAFTFSMNWYEIATGGSYFASVSPQLLRHLWFVALLAQVTVLLPAVVLLTRRFVPERLRPLVPLALAALSALLMGVLYSPDADPTRVYFGTDTHCFGLMIGLALAWAWHDAVPDRWAGPLVPLARRVMPWAATAALVTLASMAVVMGQDAAAFRGGLLAASLLTVLMVLGANTEGSWMDGLFGWRPIALLGRYSYGLYLWHWPIYLLVQLLLPGWRGRGIWLIWLITLALTVAMTAVSWYAVERPAIAWADRVFGRRRGAIRASGMPLALRRIRSIAAAVAVVALLAGFVQGLRVAPEKSSVQLDLERNQAALDADAQQRVQDAQAAREAKQRAEEEAKARAQAKDEALRNLTGDDVTVVGDSVTVGSTPALQAALPNVVVDAKTSRFIREAPDIIAQLKQQGQLRKYVVVSMNTNSAADVAMFDRIASAMGDGHVMIIVNGYGDRSWIPVSNQAAIDYVRGHPATAALADWNTAIAAHTEWLASDGIHPNGQGAELYANTVKDAIATWIASQTALP